jgi:hypothetical protein
MSVSPSIILVCCSQRHAAETAPALDAWESALRGAGLLPPPPALAAGGASAGAGAGAGGDAPQPLPLQLAVSAAGYKAAEFWALARGLPVRALVNSGRCGGADTACVAVAAARRARAPCSSRAQLRHCRGRRWLQVCCYYYD